MSSIPLAAKQDAFEESIRLKNQFRNLEEDEVEFLDSVLESTRKKEEEVKKQTSEQLDLFRRQQEEADKATIEGDRGGTAEEGTKGEDPGEKWTINKGKRKRVEEKKGLTGFKLRKSSSSSAHEGGGIDAGAKSPSLPVKSPPTEPNPNPQPKANASSKDAASTTTPLPSTTKATETISKPLAAARSDLGLAGYSSDDED